MKIHTRTLIVVLFATFAAAGAGGEPGGSASQAAPVAVIYLVRHAETEFPPYADSPPDPALNEVGLARAAALADRLEPTGLDHVFSTNYRRTRSTARPAAHAAGVTVEAYDPGDLQGFARRLRTLRGHILVVGHSNTTPALVAALGGEPGEPIDERSEFDRLYALTLHEGHVSTARLRYGARLPERLLRDGATTRDAARVGARGSFTFYSSFWLNLHDTLYWKTQPRGGAPADNACLRALPSSMRADWQDSADYYAMQLAERNARTDPLMRELRFHFTGLSDEPLSAEARAVQELLRAAAPAYQLCLWPEHDHRNRRWIADLLGLLDAHGRQIQRRLTDLYADPWPRTIPVDVVSYASWAGANTTGEPLHMMLSSADSDNVAPGSLEIVFHEGSHGVVGAGWGNTYAALENAFAPRGLDAGRGIWHSVIFYTTGRVTQETLRAAGIADYQPYMVRVGVYRELYPLLEANWQPYLDGEIDLAEAARRYAQAVASSGAGDGDGAGAAPNPNGPRALVAKQNGGTAELVPIPDEGRGAITMTSRHEGSWRPNMN